jgi:type IX secretion system substrate protein/F5/8 type C domain-containing protein
MKNKYLSIIILVFAFCLQGNAQCLEDTHTPFANDGWKSCTPSMNPNPAHPAGHWILYDLGYEYVLDSTYIWNYNAWGENDIGVQGAIFDYSLDGNTWSNLGTFFIEQASGSYKYQGVQGPDFEGVTARYVLVTAVSNWGNDDCTGLAEIKFFVTQTVGTEPELERMDNLMVVSPNPVEDIANVSIKSDLLPESVALYDLAGRLIEEKNTILSMNVSFQMKGLPGGIYFVKARVGEDVLTEKIVKVK